jgi:HK97 family phage major capsid protein
MLIAANSHPSRALVSSVFAAARMPLPRGLISAQAHAAGAGGPSVQESLARLDEMLEGRVEALDGRLQEIEATIGDAAARNAAERLGGPANFTVEDREYTRTFASFFRKGSGEEDLRKANAEGYRAQIHAAMSVGDNSSGGYLAPVEWDRRISKALVSVSPMRRLATVQTTGVGAYYSIWNNAAWGSGWVGETAARPATTTADLSQINYASGELYAMPAITQRLLDDSQLDVEQWLSAEVETEFARQEGIAFLGGNGTNKPYGLLQYVPGGAAETQHPGGTLGITLSGHATLLGGTDAAAADMLVGFTYSLTAPYRQNASWLMNSQTAAAIAKLKDGNGNFLWREAFQAGQPPLLLGRPVEFDEGMPNIGAGTYPIAYGDFRAGYLINDRLGTRVLRDPFTNKPFVMFYVTKRVGAGVKDPNAIRLLKIAAA